VATTTPTALSLSGLPSNGTVTRATASPVMTTAGPIGYML
jgi:hypothetical protein